jgi:hypothetical protein
MMWPMRAISARRSVRRSSHWYRRAFSIAMAAWRAKRASVCTSASSKRRGGSPPTPKKPSRRSRHRMGTATTAW